MCSCFLLDGVGGWRAGERRASGAVEASLTLTHPLARSLGIIVPPLTSRVPRLASAVRPSVRPSVVYASVRVRAAPLTSNCESPGPPAPFAPSSSRCLQCEMRPCRPRDPGFLKGMCRAEQACSKVSSFEPGAKDRGSLARYNSHSTRRSGKGPTKTKICIYINSTDSSLLSDDYPTNSHNKCTWQ